MKYIIILFFLLVSSLGYGQTSFVKDAAARLDKALVSKDTVVLKQLLHRETSFGHSNGWVQSKDDVIRDLSTGKLTYKKIESGEATWTAASDWATRRATTTVVYLMDGKEGELKLHVLQVWYKTNKGWQLIARQSTKI